MLPNNTPQSGQKGTKPGDELPVHDGFFLFLYILFSLYRPTLKAPHQLVTRHWRSAVRVSLRVPLPGNVAQQSEASRVGPVVFASYPGPAGGSRGFGLADVRGGGGRVWVAAGRVGRRGGGAECDTRVEVQPAGASVFFDPAFSEPPAEAGSGDRTFLLRLAPPQVVLPDVFGPGGLTLGEDAACGEVLADEIFLLAVGAFFVEAFVGDPAGFGVGVVESAEGLIEDAAGLGDEAGDKFVPVGAFIFGDGDLPGEDAQSSPDGLVGAGDAGFVVGGEEEGVGGAEGEEIPGDFAGGEFVSPGE